MRTITLAVLALALCASAAATGAAAAPPTAEAATLSAADFLDGASVNGENASKSSFLPALAYSSAYARSFTNVAYDGVRFVALISAVEIAKSTVKAAAAVAAIAAEVRSTVGRQKLVDFFKQSLTNNGGSAARTSVLRHRAIAVGELTVDLDIAIEERGATVDIGVMFIQDGPAVETLVDVASAPGLRAGGGVSLAKLAVARITAASTPPPTNTAVPTIAGSPELGQILQAQPGSWTGSQLGYAYQWFRCNTAGGACVAIAGSSQQTYTVSNADEGATLAISVVTTNPAGTTIAMSHSTALVP